MDQVNTAMRSAMEKEGCRRSREKKTSSNILQITCTKDEETVKRELSSP
jgi:hypothetical protein